MSATGQSEPPAFPPRGRARTFGRFLLAILLVVALAAGATATAGLLGVQSFVDDIKQGGTIKNLAGVITRVQAGDPQTILLIGSDHRFGHDKADARSDTMILVRLDPDANATTVLSVPRDLKVTYTAPNGALAVDRKINETYTVGGEALTAKVIKHLLHVDINHIVNLNFKGFKAVVDAIGCVYIDVDRRYYHSNLGLPPSLQYAEIDVSAGYQKLCGQKALDYVRFRHADSDFVRAARQQDFLRQAKAQYGVDRFLGDPHQITKQIGRYLRTDAALQSKEELLRLANLLAYSAGKPIREVHFPIAYDNTSSGSYVVASAAQLAQVRHEFLTPDRSKPGDTGGGHRGHRGGRAGTRKPHLDGLTNAQSSGEDYAIRLGPLQFPIYYPKLILGRGGYAEPLQGEYPRAYRIKAPDGKMRGAYRLVLSAGEDGNYYGIQGTTWTDPPILRNPSSDTRTIDGKHLELFYDGKHLRLVAWRTHRAVYWVSNTLQEKLTNDQMLAIAGSLTRLGGHG